MSLISRLQRVGLLSLTALILGGLVLILTSLNGLASPGSINGKSPPDGLKVFRYGSQISIQAWIAITGIGFGLLSYGFKATYIHFFDWWCSRQAQRHDGLDYGVYLNSQPQAPVLYGWRGFPRLITLRYLVVLASIAASVGYKFGIVDVELSFLGTLDLPVGHVNIKQGGLLLLPSTFSTSGEIKNPQVPWLTDRPTSRPDNNQAFLHQVGEDFQPPQSTIMTGILSCDGAELRPVSYGTIYTREIVIVANMTDLPVEDEKLVVGGNLGWSQAISDGYGWFDPSEKRSRAWVEYRSYQTGEFDVRWAKYRMGAYINDTVPVARHVKYEMHYATAEVVRKLEDMDCSRFGAADPPIRLLSNSNTSASNATSTDETSKWDWANSMIASWGSDARIGVSSVIQVAMTIFLLTLYDLYIQSPLQFVPGDTQPFGPEKTPPSYQYIKGNPPHPILEGAGWKAAGIWTIAAGVFLAIGLFSVLVGLIRVCIGPPILTSWMGQHVFLTKSGKVQFSMSQGDLATGYKAASAELGLLRLPKERTG
ncbi:hypothetical protein E5D57_009939 [Metarhizium anisopliae]|nr:hypothetical protein E5D57_009939 [Metarhizium anisopliae]